MEGQLPREADVIVVAAAAVAVAVAVAVVVAVETVPAAVGGPGCCWLLLLLGPPLFH